MLPHSRLGIHHRKHSQESGLTTAWAKSEIVPFKIIDPSKEKIALTVHAVIQAGILVQKLHQL